MKALRTLAAVPSCGLLVAGCVIVPVTSEGFDPDCRVVTHHLALQPVQLARFEACSDRGCEALVLAGLGVAAVSAVVSGSIVVVGNVVYWADHRASCLAPAAAPAASDSA